MKIDSGFIMNSVFWLSSARPGEQGWITRIIDDVSVACCSNGFPYQTYEVPSKAALLDALDKIEAAAVQGCRPLLYLDMHGSAIKGVEIAASGEYVSWATLVEKFRRINIATGNNLVVVAAACFGLHAIKQTTITRPVPFFMMIAPEHTINVGFLESRIYPFFLQMLSGKDVVAAYRDNLEPQMRMFHCVKIFLVSMAKYIDRQCKGKGGEQRRERLLTDILLEGRGRTTKNLRQIRAEMKGGLKPSQAMLDRFAEAFLIGKPLNASMEDLLREIDAAQPALQRQKQAKASAPK